MAKYFKYKNLNKAFAKKKTPKEETVIIDDTSDINSSSSSEAYNSPDEDDKTSIAYDSESANNEKSSNSSIGSEGNIWLNGCRGAFIIDKLKSNSKSKIKEHTPSSNNLDKVLHYAHLLNILWKPTNKYKQTKSNNKLKHIHFSPIIFVKIVIPSSKKDIQSKTRLFKALFHSGASESILAKEKADTLPVKKTKKERQWSTSAGVLTTNTKTATSFSFPELHTNKLINQSLLIVDLNIDRYDMNNVRDLIR